MLIIAWHVYYFWIISILLSLQAIITSMLLQSYYHSILSLLSHGDSDARHVLISGSMSIQFQVRFTTSSRPDNPLLVRRLWRRSHPPGASGARSGRCKRLSLLAQRKATCNRDRFVTANGRHAMNSDEVPGVQPQALCRINASKRSYSFVTLFWGTRTVTCTQCAQPLSPPHSPSLARFS